MHKTIGVIIPIQRIDFGKRRGEGGKIIMSDFGKRRGESIILFAEKEFKPEGRGRRRGGGALLLLLFVFARRRGGEHHFFGANEAIERQQVGWRGSGGQRE